MTDEDVGLDSLGSVFRQPDPFDQPFQPQIKRRAILYPVFYELDDDQFQALGHAIEAIDEDSFFLRFLVQMTPNGWKCATSDLSKYQEIMKANPLLPSAAYSTEGTWGLLISDEWHCVVGGPPRFLDVLLDSFPYGEGAGPLDQPNVRIVEPAKQVHEFLRITLAQEQGKTPEWTERLLVHVYGRERAGTMLATRR